MMSYTERARALRPYIEKASVSLEDADALEAVELFPAWAVGADYKLDERIQFEATLYRVVQAHTAQEGWEPPNAPALFTRVSLDEWPEWVQPTGVQDAYNTGDKVTFEGKHYICLTDGNVYSPSVYPQGWQEQE